LRADLLRKEYSDAKKQEEKALKRLANVATLVATYGCDESEREGMKTALYTAMHTADAQIELVDKAAMRLQVAYRQR
jgi:hypothetical protein